MSAGSASVRLEANLAAIARSATEPFKTNVEVEGWAGNGRAFLCVTALAATCVKPSVDVPVAAKPPVDVVPAQKRDSEQAGVVPNTHELAKRKKQRMNDMKQRQREGTVAVPFEGRIMLCHRAHERPSDVIKGLSITLQRGRDRSLKKFKLQRAGGEPVSSHAPEGAAATAAATPQPSFHANNSDTVWLFTDAARAVVTPPYSAVGVPQGSEEPDVDVLVPGHPLRGTVHQMHPSLVLPLVYQGAGNEVHFLPRLDRSEIRATPGANMVSPPPRSRSRSRSPPRPATSVAECPDVLADLASVPAPACVTDDQRDHSNVLDVRWYTTHESPELDTFRSLKTKPLVKPTGPDAARFTSAEREIEGGLVYAEGGSTLEVILAKQHFDVREVLLKPSHYLEHRDSILRYATERRTARPSAGRLVVRVVHNTPLLRLLDYKSISGACQIATIARPKTPFPFDPSVKRILVLDGLTNADNTGSLIRSAACFGIQGVILSRNNCSPWARRCVRVSMGHVFTMPVYQIDDDTGMTLPEIIKMYRERNVRTFAAVVQQETERLHDVRRRDTDEGYLVVMGSEFDGVSRPVRDACESELKIDQADDVDSLSVAIATPLLLYHMRILFGVRG